MGTSVRSARREERLRISMRALRELGLVYREKLDAVRELIQNAIDAGATRIDIWVDRDKLVVEHDGEPITGEYLEAFLTVGTDFKARRGGYVGMYGIGRLSWLLLGHTAVIETANQRLVWREESLDRIEVEEIDGYVNGVRWIIHLRSDARIAPDDIERYVSRNYFGSVPVYVNGKRIEPAIGDAKLLFADDLNRAYLAPGLHYGVVVKECFAVERDYYLEKLVVFTSDPRVRINPARQVVYGEEYYEWRSYVLRKVLETVKRVYTPYEAVKAIGLNTLSKWVYDAFIDARSRISYLPFETADCTYVWGSVLDPGKWVYSDKRLDDTSVIALARKGIRVVYVPSDRVVDWLSEAGFRRAEDLLLVEEVRTSVVSESVARRIREVYDFVKTVVDEKIGGATMPSKAAEVGGRTAEIRLSAGAIELVYRTDEVGAPVVNVVRARIVGRINDASIVFVEHPDDGVKAFTDGTRIYVNVRNRTVARILAITKRYRSLPKIVRVWAPILVHEMLHMRGYDHRDPQWVPLYEDIITEIYIRCEEMLRKRRGEG